MSFHTPVNKCRWCKHFYERKGSKGQCYHKEAEPKETHVNSKCDNYELYWADMRGPVLRQNQKTANEG